jgi:hypothetical protein
LKWRQASHGKGNWRVHTIHTAIEIFPEGEIARILNRSGTGFAVCEGDGKALAHAIMTLAEDAGLAATLGKKARALFESKFDFPKAAGAWEQVLAGVQTEAQAPRGWGIRRPWRRS